jgi:hypothetical protein
MLMIDVAGIASVHSAAQLKGAAQRPRFCNRPSLTFSGLLMLKHFCRVNTMSSEFVLPYETRRWPRYTIDMPVRLIAQRPTKVVIVEGRGRELNRGGMAVLAGVELSIDEQVAFEFTSPYAGQPIRVRSFVRNCRGYKYGVEFITENDADHKNVGQIESILKTLGSVS